jgi:AcrR family transcriptional regulator
VTTEPVRRARRERQREQTRIDLIRAARELIAEHGVAGLRVSDITDRTDVALGSFYSHFESKDEIVEAVVSTTVASLMDAIMQAGEALEDPAEVPCVGIRLMVRLCVDDPAFGRLLLNLEDVYERFEQAVWPQALEVIRDGVRAGRLTTDTPEMALTVAVGGVLSVMRSVLAGRYGTGADVDCAVVWLRGVGLSEAEARRVANRPLPEITFSGG